MQNDLTRPIIGIQNRTAQEVFDIMSDRIRSELSTGRRTALLEAAEIAEHPVYGWKGRNIAAAIRAKAEGA